MNRLDRVEIRSRAFRKGLFVWREGDGNWPSSTHGRPRYVLVDQRRPDHSLAIGTIELMDRCVRAWRTDNDLIAMWQKAGGTWDGPGLGTAKMPESSLIKFLRSLGA